MTDTHNYDGFTLIQFLADVIKKNDLDISLDMLSETEPPIPMAGVRSTQDTAYSLVTNLLKNIVDDITEDRITQLKASAEAYIKRRQQANGAMSTTTDGDSVGDEPW